MKILFICGSLNQTTMMHKISMHLKDHTLHFTPYYADGIVRFLAERGLLDNTILGGRHRRDCMRYLNEQNLTIDHRGSQNDYDLVLTGSDAIIQRNVKHKRLILVQEGMTEPEKLMFHIVRALKLPRWLANTSVTGISNAFDAFCVASEGYRELFVHKGVQPEKIVVTGIPNFDNLASISAGEFAYKNHVLVATTPFRETMRVENRRAFIRDCMEIANSRQLIFKLHPLENAPRAIEEINNVAPDALVFWRGDVNAMMLNASAVITQLSTCTFTALALGKEVHSDLDVESLKKLMPIQNGGISAKKIATVCRSILNTPMTVIKQKRMKLKGKRFWEFH
jgi:hypothetical protein